MRRSVSNSPNTLLDIQRALQAKRLAEVLVADETESENQQQESVTTKKLTIFDENYWKFVKLRRTPFLKTDNFRRKFVKIGEIEAHSFFEK